MDYRSLTALALRLSGALMLAYGVAAMPTTFATFYTADVREGVTPAFLSILLLTLGIASGPIVIGSLLILFPSIAASRAIDTTAVGPESSVGYRELQALAFSVLGLYFLAVGLFDAAYWFARSRLYYHLMIDATTPAFPKSPSFTPEEFGGFISAALEIVGGVILFLGAKGLSGLLRRLRGAGGIDR